jgi:hypothetical protein
MCSTNPSIYDKLLILLLDVVHMFGFAKPSAIMVIFFSLLDIFLCKAYSEMLYMKQNCNNIVDGLQKILCSKS